VALDRYALPRAAPRAAVEAHIAVLQSEFKSEESDTLKIIEMEKAKTERFAQEQKKMAESRKADKFIKKTLKQPSKI